MSQIINFKRYTGGVRYEQGIFGVKIYLEYIGTKTFWQDCSESPEFIYWKKARAEDLYAFEIKLKK